MTAALAFWQRALLCLAALLVVSGGASAHPADEFCTPGGGMDPELCRALEDLDSAERREALPGGLPPRAGEIDVERAWHATVWLYLTIGVGHILPGGADHILFVAALALSTPGLRSLLVQISAFTVAHTVTLGLAAAGVFSPPAGLVEPLIAATIALVGLETLAFREPPAWRAGLVFLFGLVHGMGFAGFFGALGLPEGQFVAALVGFNIGVELGQIAVVLATLSLAMAVRSLLAGAERERAMRKVFTLPLAVAISAIGIWWLIERLQAAPG